MSDAHAPYQLKYLSNYFRWFSFSDWCQLIPDDHHAKTLIMASAEAVREVETASMNDIIDLNVGGTKFQTTRYLWTIKNVNWQCSLLFFSRQTLLHDPNSMLARMFDPVSPLCPGEVHHKKLASLTFIVLEQMLSHNCSAYLCLWYPRPHLYLLRSEKRWSVFPWQRSNPF